MITIPCVNKDIQNGLFRIFKEENGFTFISSRGEFPIIEVNVFDSKIIRCYTSNDEKLFFITTDVEHKYKYVYMVSSTDFLIVRSFLNI